MDVGCCAAVGGGGAFGDDGGEGDDVFVLSAGFGLLGYFVGEVDEVEPAVGGGFFEAGEPDCYDAVGLSSFVGGVLVYVLCWQVDGDLTDGTRPIELL